MKDLLKMIEAISIQEALTLSAQEDMIEVASQMEKDFNTMSDDEILEIGLNNDYISIEDIDEARRTQ